VPSDPRGRGWRHAQFAGSRRSLARAGIPVCLACDTRFCPAGFSRHCTLLRVPDLKGRGLVEGLLSIAGRIVKKAVLILSGDLQVVAVSRAGAALEAQYFLDLPTETMVDVPGGKAKFQAYAEEIGLRVPRAVVLDQGHDEQALDVLSTAAVLKPVDLQV
jgi:predicted ATP-grasp superfamily ATP-dependent carboligase